VTPGYFQTLGTRLIAGRDFTTNDRAQEPNVVIVSASAAQRYWPGRNPVGERILVATQRAPGSLDQPRWQTVIGVVEDVRYRGVTDPRLDLYMPAAQSAIRMRQLLVRTTRSPAQLASDVRAIAQELDPAAYVGPPSPMEAEIARETAPWRFAMHVLSAFGMLAGALAAVGLAGFVSLVVALRRHELAIRAALGATPYRLRAHVLGETARTTVAASGIGVILTLVLARLVERVLVETPPHDPLAIGAAVMVTLAAGMIGCARPAARATAADPANVLRD
jgi:hypothetical protein